MFAKKNLVAAAALLALAGAAQADVKAYGTVDMSFGSFESLHAKGTDSRVTAVQSGAMMTSYIGFGGSEELGGGLKAEFALESFIDVDTGKASGNINGDFWSRASWVAVGGNFGRVIVGQYDNAFFTQGWMYSAFGSSMAFSPTMHFLYSDNYGNRDTGVYLATQGVTSIQLGTGFDTAWQNSLTYESPNFAGFTVSAQYAPKETTASGNARDNYTLSAGYNAGPLSAMLTYAQSGVDNNYYLAKQKVWGVGASYDLGVVKLLGQFTQVKTTDGITATAGTSDLTLKAYEIGVVVPVSEAGAVLASYGEGKYTADAIDGSFKHKIFSLGYDHKLSKRTDVYAGFKNDAGTGADSGQTFAVGIKHNF